MTELFSDEKPPLKPIDLKALLEKNGYFNVRITTFKESFRIHYETAEFSATRNCFFPFSKVTRAWLWKCFPRVKAQ